MTAPLHEGPPGPTATGPGPSSARRIFDHLEAEVGELATADAAAGDFADSVPGSSEPPD